MPDWDAKYRAADRAVPDPDPFLIEARPLCPQAQGSVALDLACGGGRHAIRLASWGFRVDAVDLSAEALRLCRDCARIAGVDGIQLHRKDLEDPGTALEEGRYDLAAVFNFLHRPLVPVLKRCVRPGGIVIYKTFTRDQLRFQTGPRNPDYLLEREELQELFGNFRHLLYRETCDVAATAALVAQRP